MTLVPREMLVKEMRYALRTLRKSPGFTMSCVAVLALAIGANTAMFSVLNAVLLRPLPYRSPEQLAILWTEDPGQDLREGRAAYWDVEQWRKQSSSFADFAVLDPVSVTLANADGVDKISVARVSPNFFRLLGVQPLVGRSFSVEEAGLRQRVALISYSFWQSRFGGARDAIGAAVELDGLPSRIIGILPADFQFDGAEVWESHTMFPDWQARLSAGGARSWIVVARLRPGVTLSQAQAEMNTIARRSDEQLPASERGRGVSVVPLSLQVTGRGARLALGVLTAAVFLVLLVAAGNVAGLWLARGAGREREIAIRAAIGAGRTRIVRQLLVESVTLALLSGLLGLLVSSACIRFILAVRPGNLARLGEVGLDWGALGCAFALCLVAGTLVGLAPAITMARRNLESSGLANGRGIAGGVAARRTRRALVVGEFAMAVVLLVGAGLLLRSLWAVENVSLGFRPERVLSVQLATPALMAEAQRANFYDRVLESAASLAGVESTGVIGDFFIGGAPEQVVTAEGDSRAATQRLRLRRDEVSAAFFRAVGTPLLRGRLFSAADGPGSPRVAIVNDAMARRLWPGGDAVGRRFKLGSQDSGGPWFTVVGVAGDMRRQGLEREPVAQMFEPLAQNPSRLATLLVRTSRGDPLRMAGAVRAAVRRVDKYAPVYGVTTLESRLGSFLAERRFQTSLLTGFSAFALLISALGIYGLIQYSVTTRAHEIGIRVAVGANAGEIFRMLLGEGLKLSLTGLALGLVGALWLGRAVSSLLFGVSPTDPLTFISVSLLLTMFATAACFLPARRAMKIEPMAALRKE